MKNNRANLIELVTADGNALCEGVELGCTSVLAACFRGEHDRSQRGVWK